MAVARADGSFESTNAFTASSLRSSSARPPARAGASARPPRLHGSSAGSGEANRE